MIQKQTRKKLGKQQTVTPHRTVRKLLLPGCVKRIWMLISIRTHEARYCAGTSTSSEYGVIPNSCLNKKTSVTENTRHNKIYIYVVI